MKPELNFIGTIETPYTTVEECPNNIQTNGPLCQITLYDKYEDGLIGLESGQNILVLYWFENTDRTAVQQNTRDGKTVTGTFSLRSPHRPNPIAVAVLPIEKIAGGQITVRGLDCLNGTKLIDVKPAIKQEAALAGECPPNFTGV